MLAGLLLCACGHAPETRNKRYTQAAESSQRAQVAYQRGEYQAAIKLYQISLQLDRSIENTDGIAINLLNLAKAHQALGQPAESHRYLDLLLGEKSLEFKRAHLAAAAAQKALLKLGENNANEASGWVDKAAGYCIAECRINGVIYNLRANIALFGNDADTALYWGNRGVSENKAGQQVEYANSLRLAAQARILKKEFDAALPMLNDALAVDKTLGLPEKIRLDLTQLAHVYEGMGKQDSAAQYRERAMRVGGVEINNEAKEKP